MEDHLESYLYSPSIHQYVYWCWSWLELQCSLALQLIPSLESQTTLCYLPYLWLPGKWYLYPICPYDSISSPLLGSLSLWCVDQVLVLTQNLPTGGIVAMVSDRPLSSCDCVECHMTRGDRSYRRRSRVRSQKCSCDPSYWRTCCWTRAIGWH